MALLGLPSIVVYKTTFINYLIGKYILKIGYISLPNLVLNDEIFPELIQKDCEAKNIEKHMKKILENLPEIEEKIENGDVKAMNNLANFYAKNDQIEQAEKYYKIAIQNGSKKAEKNLKILEKFPLMSDPMVMDDLAWDIPMEDAKGELKISIRGFKENGKDLNEYERNRMKRIVRKIWNKLYESADLEFIGYNDNTENKKLSLERAKRLAELFRESGLKDEMRIVKVLGKGSENPVDSNDTIAERYNNRRVEIIVKNVVEKNFDLSLLNELKNQLEDE